MPLLILVSIGTSKFNLEVAKTSQEKNQGLMNRIEIDNNQGMVFDISNESPVCMWMKDTFIPLDIIFLDNQGFVLKIIENVQPQTLDPRCYHGREKIRYVIEILGGMSKKVGLKILDKILINY